MAVITAVKWPLSHFNVPDNQAARRGRFKLRGDDKRAAARLLGAEPPIIGVVGRSWERSSAPWWNCRKKKKKNTAVKGRSNLLCYQHRRQGVLVIAGHVITRDYAVGWLHIATTVQGLRSCFH